MQMPAIGSLFQAKYRLCDVLGRGGFATVFRAEDETAGRTVAIKVIDPGEYGYSAGMQERFLREVRVLANLRDPHTITMFDYGRTDDGLLYMVFEYVEGRDLEQVIGARRLTEAQTQHVLVQVLHSLREAHEAGLLHRDIKPANIRVFEYMGDPLRVKLLDFGIARAATVEDKKITQDGAMVGTPQYMAPEQVFGDELTPASDLYSLGLVAFEMLTGRAAIDGGSASDILRQQASLAPVTIPAELPISAEFRRLLEHMLVKHPRGRVQTAAAVLAELERIAATHRTAPVEATSGPHAAPPVLARPVGDPDVSTGPTVIPAMAERGPTPTTRPSPAPTSADTRLLLAGGAVLALGLLVTAGITILLAGPEESEPPPRPPPVSAPAVPSEADVAFALEVAADEVALGVLVASRDGVSGADAKRGCGGTYPGGKALKRYTFDGREREAAIYAPQSYDGSVRHPVVLLFHDNRESTPGQFLEESRFPELADREPMILVSPQSFGSDPGAIVPPRPWRQTDHELAFARFLLEEVRRDYCVDPSRLYVVGHGGGGRMARRARCELSASAVALTSHRLHPGEELCEPERAVPVIHFWGEQDGYSPRGGGVVENCEVRRPRLSLAKNDDVWRRAQGCRAKETIYEQVADYQCRAFEGCDASFVSCAHGAGHGWPGTRYTQLEAFASGCFGPPPKFDLPEVIYRFFQREGVAASEP